jgi:hypothetical protein
MSNLYRGPSRDASYQGSVHLAVVSEEKNFRNRPTRNNNCLWWPCLPSDQNKMSYLYRGPSYQLSVHLDKRFQRRRFLEIDQSETRIAYGGMFVNGSERNEQSL